MGSSICVSYFTSNPRFASGCPNNCLHVDPYLPEWLPELTLRRVEVGKASVDLRFWRDGESTKWDAAVQEGDVEVKQQTWQPWSVE